MPVLGGFEGQGGEVRTRVYILDEDLDNLSGEVFVIILEICSWPGKAKFTNRSKVGSIL
jgi:hypothetical protein